MKAQTIQVDSTFTADGEIFPFEPNDTIFGLSISGSVNLLSDTSLVRVILTDNSGAEWMVYEAYPMIVSGSPTVITSECDETCYLDESLPHSISVQIINAEIHISYLTCSLTQFQNLSALQYQAKKNKDLEKIQLINQYIALKGWNWLADTNELAEMYYYEKAILFDKKYNLLGRDFYSGGSFYSVLHDNIPQYSDRSIISSFDWREKHNAHLISSPYYKEDDDIHPNGWLTGIRSQGGCGACSAFASIASLEAAINLYANYQFDVDENAEFSEKDAFNCSNNNGGHEGCDCLKGKEISKILYKLQDEGVVNEECYPYLSPYCESATGYCEDFSSKCSSPNWTAQICDYETYDLYEFESQTERVNYLKELILENGPLTIVLHLFPGNSSKPHAVSLIGFYFNETTGKIEWIFKNSWGNLWGKFGYGYEPFWIGNSSWAPHIDRYGYTFVYNPTTCPNPINVTCYNDPEFEYEVHETDFDQDGYYNWGIGPRPSSIYPCGENVEEEDSNDN